MIKQLTHDNNDFYTVMGPVLGSRVVERETGDRFYDDADKVWTVSMGTEGVKGVISVADGVIKNVYLPDAKAAKEIIKKIGATSKSKVPAVYKDIFADNGYTVELIDRQKKFVYISK